jgi:hypothetical protein
MRGYRNPLLALEGKTQRKAERNRYAFLKPGETPGLAEAQAALTLAAALYEADRNHRLADPSGPHEPVADLSPRDETQATPAPIERHSPERDIAGRQGAGDGQHLYAVEAEVVQIGYGRTLKARRRGMPFPHPTGGSAA